MNEIPGPGAIAPQFTLPDTMEETASLAEFRGKWVILYFYPKDNTSGCTAEAIDFTAMKGDFEKLGSVVLGISPDSCKSHQKFMVKYSLGIRLLSDTGSKVCGEYGVWQKKKMYGNEYMGVSRTTFLINPTGVIERVWENVKVQGHADEVLDALRALTL